MKRVVAILAPGNMGAAVGARLVEHGVEVLTSLVGRSESSRERARAAGMIDCPDEQLAQADFVLSILPPGAAVALAERLAPKLAGSRRKPLYVDCNAVSPETVRRIGERIAGSGVPFVDAGIIGPPPRAGGTGPRFYASGPHADRFAVLADGGLDIRVLGAEIGAASALKMSYAGIGKGLTAIGIAMLLAAARSGVADALHAELAASQRELLAFLERTVPATFPKAYRYVGEMREIAAFTGDDAAAAAMYRGAAELYARLAGDVAGDRDEARCLEEILGLR